jgi:Ca2+-binding EF-hand superfamily protein
MFRLLLQLAAFAILCARASAASPELPAPTAKPPRANPEAVFKRIDTNGDGKISREEFKAFIEKSLKGKKSDKPELIDKLFDRLDTNGDGYLSLDEFKQLRELREKLLEKRKAQKDNEESKPKK